MVVKLMLRVNQSKRKFNFRSVIRRSFLFLDRASEERILIKDFKVKLRQFVNCYDDLNRDQKYDLYSTILSIYRACYSVNVVNDRKNSPNNFYTRKLSLNNTYDRLLKAVRRIQKELDLKEKQDNLRAMLQAQDIIFFACSIHTNPAEDHKDWQGVIFVDRFWRTKVRGYTYRAVEAYIRNHGTKTVQEIVGPPVYLTTRPYCKHFFIPLETSAVLRSSARRISESLAKVGSSVLFDRKEYYDLRSSVYRQLNDVHPCKEYRIKIKSWI